MLETADAARRDEPFFLVTRWHSEIRQVETVLTLRAEDVVAAEVLSNGVRVDDVVGRGRPRDDRRAVYGGAGSPVLSSSG
jgi:hypothetical protein